MLLIHGNEMKENTDQKPNLKSLVNFFFNAEKNMSVVKPHVPFCRTEETLPTLEIPC